MIRVIKKILSIFKKKKKKKYLKYWIGDEVKVTIYSDIPEFWYKGKVLDVGARRVGPSTNWIVEYYVSFHNSKGDELRYWFLESELRKQSLQEERNSIIEQILN